jgi:membrane dipeptidase
MEPAADQAKRIAETSIIIDTHIDVPYKQLSDYADLTVTAEDRDFDVPRARAGGLNVPFMSIYTPAKLEAEGRSREVAEQLIDAVERMVNEAPETFAIARSVADVRRQFDDGLISLPMGMENGSPIEGDLANLRHFYERGIRYLSLSHGKSNHLSDSSYDENHQWDGLSDFGVEVIHEMNRMGIMIDVTHVSDDAFWQIIELSEAPVLASHSSARKFTPGWERNMSDKMIKALADNGGVIQINFGSSFVTEEAHTYSQKFWPASEAWAAEHPDAGYEGVQTIFRPQYEAENGPFPYASLDDVLDHFDHVVSLVGVDHVGIGSDYDGVGDSLPAGLKDVSSYPNLVGGLLDRGYSEADIRKILGENLLRVWSEVEALADQAATTSSST